MLDAERLLGAAATYLNAVREHEEHPDTQTADGVTAARLTIDETLLDAGWIPPLDRMNNIERDRAIVEQRPGWLDDPTYS
jgi:hypothetical protein